MHIRTIEVSAYTWWVFVYYSMTGDNSEARRHSTKTSAPQRPRPPVVYTPSNDNNNSGSRDAVGKSVEPSRAAPPPPSRPAQPTAYSVSAGVAFHPTRAAPTQPAKPPPPTQLTQPPSKPPPPSQSTQPPAKPPPPSQPAQPPAKPPKPAVISEPPTEPLDQRPVPTARPDASRPPLPKKPAVSNC